MSGASFACAHNEGGVLTPPQHSCQSKANRGACNVTRMNTQQLARNDWEDLVEEVHREEERVSNDPLLSMNEGERRRERIKAKLFAALVWIIVLVPITSLIVWGMAKVMDPTVKPDIKLFEAS